MYAVVRTGGKQYRVVKDGVVIVEKLAGEPGGDVEIGEVLVLNDGNETTIGAPLVEGARVFGTVVAQDKTDKVIIFKRKRRKNHRRTRGHRQSVTVLRITDILAKGQERAPRAEPVAAPKEAGSTEARAKASAKKAAAKKAPPKRAAAPKKAAARKAPAKKPAARKKSKE